MTDETIALSSKTEVDPYSIPGGMLCTVCGLRYYSKSMGGPGICPSCDCGNFGQPVVDVQCKEIERLRAFITQWTYEGSLQTFEDRARFRTEAQRLLAAAAPESRDG